MPKSTERNDRAAEALTFIPVLLSQLDAEGRDMLASVLQASIEAGYDNGFRDGQQSKEGSP